MSAPSSAAHSAQYLAHCSLSLPTPPACSETTRVTLLPIHLTSSPMQLPAIRRFRLLPTCMLERQWPTSGESSSSLSLLGAEDSAMATGQTSKLYGAGATTVVSACNATLAPQLDISKQHPYNREVLACRPGFWCSIGVVIPVTKWGVCKSTAFSRLLYTCCGTKGPECGVKESKRAHQYQSATRMCDSSDW